jgi:serine protease Do
MQFGVADRLALAACASALAVAGCRRLEQLDREALEASTREPMAAPSAAPSASGGAVASATPPAAPGPAPFSSPPTLPGAPDVATLAARVRPAVVNITVTEEVRTSQAPELPFDFFGPGGPFGGGPPEGDRALPRRALGSGFIIDEAGHVVTNAHVVAHASSVRVRLLDKREFKATVRGRDPRLDVAVLDLVDAKGLPAVAMGSSEALRVGDYVTAIGNPFGLSDTVTMGIVSAKSRAIGASPYDDFIQTDAAINPGNSGGPLLNMLGQVVGINTAINPAGQGIGFAIPIDDIKEILPQLLDTGKVSRGRLGVVVQGMDTTTAKAFGLDRPRGALVAAVEPDSPAARAGFKAGDVILGVDQTEIDDSQALPRIVARHPPNTQVKVKILREQREQTLDVTLDTLKDETSLEPSQGKPDTGGHETPSLGVKIGETRDGVTVVEVKPGTPAAGSLEPGDVILEVNHAPVRNAAEVSRLVSQAPRDRPILLKIRRDNQDRFVGIDRAR